MVQSVKEQMEKLRSDLKKAIEEVRNIERQIYKLKKSCPHDNVDKSRSWDVKGNVEDENPRDIEERRIMCNDCGHSWQEQKYVGEELWPYELGERG